MSSSSSILDDYKSEHESWRDDDISPKETPSEPDAVASSGWWRWPLIPLAAPVGATVGSTLLGILQWFGMKMTGGFYEDGWYYLYIMPLITSGAFGFLWCMISSSIAPKGKTITGTVMATVLGMLSVFTIFAFFTLQKTTGERIQVIVACIATLIGSVVAVLQTHQEESA